MHCAVVSELSEIMAVTVETKSVSPGGKGHTVSHTPWHHVITAPLLIR